MAITLQTYLDFHKLGLAAIPVKWDANLKQATEYPKHGDITEGVPSPEFINQWLSQWGEATGVAIKLMPPYGMFDFDLKNTDKKSVFQDWLNIIQSTNDKILSKICIERTRSAGYHVYIKYSKLDHKIPCARNDKGEEVISVYTGGLLSFCNPTPDYELIHNDFNDIEELTHEEYELMITTAAYFNEYQSLSFGQSKVAITDYPTEYENICLQFDYSCTDDVFETLLNSIDLYRVSNNRRYNKKSYIPFLRKGSTAEYSAKAYFNYTIEREGKAYAKSKRLLIFSASFSKFPTWHDSAKSGDNTWSLSPSKIIFYKNDKDWTATIEEIQMICDSAGVELSIQQPVTQQSLIHPDRLKFPYDIFPEELQNYIFAHRIQHEYTANFMLSAVSTALGNSITLVTMNSYVVKPVLYMAVVAPSGGGKSPAMKAAFEAVKNIDNMLYKHYAERKNEYNSLKALYDKDKKQTEPPKEPKLTQLIIKDSTIEMVIKILSDNPLGSCIYADELSGFINRIDQYKSGDEIQKWLELWSGDSVMLQRITREANKVDKPFCNIVGGIQGGLLDMFSKGANEYNGFYQRFLFAYPEPEQKSDWMAYEIPKEVIRDYNIVFNDYFIIREQDEKIYRLTPEANALYGEWFNYKNKKYNQAISDHVKGIIAKYQNYCLRFAVLIQAMNDRLNRQDEITHVSMERAIRLTEYYLGMMNKVTKFLTPDSPADKLQEPYKTLYSQLPEMFSTKVATEIAEELKIKSSTIKTWITRNISGKQSLFKQLSRGEYEKIY
jgi:hypothetical protein